MLSLSDLDQIIFFPKNTSE